MKSAMIHKSFKPAKCKTSLKMATSRIKLMKNKKEVQINRMKRELAQLLESGQDRTARIRVEHVIREEKLIGAYDLIEIYCELIAARLSIIESQKNCPIDLKEAVTSVIFAAPRCADLPELQDVQKHFKAKYGKDFVSAAIELRPDCGVSHLLIEKLSAKAPDVQTKMKALSAVAKEHSIKWDPNSFEENESKPANELLNGPNTFEKAGMMHADPSEAPNVQALHSNVQKQNEPVNFSQQNARYLSNSQNLDSTKVGGTEPSSASSLPSMRSSGIGSDRMEVRQSFSRHNDYSLGRKSWNVEFKDATSAAQAAAESAEMASIAARAAAELSIQGKYSKQNSSESHRSNFKEERNQTYHAPEFPIEHHRTESSNNDINDGTHKVQNQQADKGKHGYLDDAGQRDSFKSNNFGEETVRKHFHTSSSHSYSSTQNPGSDRIPKVQIHQMDEDKYGNSDNPSHRYSFESDNFGEETVSKQSRTSSFRSLSSSRFDEINGSNQGIKSFGYDDYAVPGPFLKADQGKISEATNMSSFDVDDNAVIFDEANSDSDDHGADFGSKYDDMEVKSFFPPSNRESSVYTSENTNIWSPKSKLVENSSPQTQFSQERRSFSEFPEHSVKYMEVSEPGDAGPVTFDHSDGPDSENENDGELDKSGPFNYSSREQDLYSTDSPSQKGGSLSDRKTVGIHQNDDSRLESNVESSKIFSSGKSRIQLDDLLESVSSFDNPGIEDQAVPRQYSSHSIGEDFEGNEVSKQTSSETGKEFNYGALTGVRQNKDYKHPPYTRNLANNVSSSLEELESVTKVDHSTNPTVSSSFSGLSSSRNDKLGLTATSSDSDSDDVITTFRQKNSQKASKVINAKLRLKPSAAFSNGGDSESEDEITKPTSSRVHLGMGLSRRTKAGAVASSSTYHSKARAGSGAKSVNSPAESQANSVISPAEVGRNPTQNYYGDEAARASTFLSSHSKGRVDSGAKSVNSPPIEVEGKSINSPPEAGRKPSWDSQGGEAPLAAAWSSRSKTRAGSGAKSVNSTALEAEVKTVKSSSGLGSFKQPSPRPKPESTTSGRGGSFKSQIGEKQSAPVRKTESKTSHEAVSEGKSVKPSHVHPKLPDYDTLAAQLQSIRANRQ